MNREPKFLMAHSNRRSLGVLLGLLLAVLLYAGSVPAVKAFDPAGMYGVDGSSRSIYTVDLSDGGWGLLGATGTTGPTSIAYNCDNGILYGLDTATDSLYTVDLESGAWTVVGSSGQIHTTAIGYDCDSSVMYGYNDSPSGGQLAVVSIETGGWTLIAGSVLPGGIRDLAFVPGGGAYAVSVDTDNLIPVNIPAGTAGTSLSAGIEDPSGLAFNTVDRVMYGAGSSADNTYSVNITTGVFTSLGSTGTTLPRGMAYVPPAPTNILSGLTEGEVTHESATFTVTVANQPNAYWQTKLTSDSTWPVAVNTETFLSSLGTTPVLNVTSLDADTGYDIRVCSASNCGAHGQIIKTSFTTDWRIDRLLFSAGGGGKLYELDTAISLASRLGSGTGFGISEGGPHGLASFGDAFWIAGDANDGLLLVSTSTWTAIEIGDFGAGIVQPRGLTGCSQKLFMVDAATDALYTLNPFTGAATQVGSAVRFGRDWTNPNPNSMLCSDGTLYMSETTTQAMYVLNQSTGVATPETGISGEPNGIVAMGTDGVTRWLISGGTDALYEWTAAGPVTRVLNVTNFGVNERFPRGGTYLSIPVTFTDVTSVDSGSVGDTSAIITGTVSGADTHDRTYYMRIRETSVTNGWAPELHMSITSGSAPAFALTGLSVGTGYTVEVSSSAAFSLTSTASHAFTTAGSAVTVPGQVTGLTATAGDAQITIEWTAPDNGGSDITDYDYSTNNGATWRSTGTTGISYVITQTGTPNPASLSNGTSYFVKVRARNFKGAGPASAASTATPQAQTAPGNVRSLGATAHASTSGQVALSWTAPASDGGSDITGYQYAYLVGTTNSGWLPSSTPYLAADAVSVTITGLTSYGILHTFWVRAINAVGNGQSTSSVTATPGGPPVAPTSLSADASEGQVSLSWTAPGNERGAITGYQYRVDAGTWTSTGQTAPNVVITGLTNDTEYSFRVRAVNAYGNGAQSSQVTATPRAGTIPGQVTGLSAEIGDQEVTLSWTAPDDGGAAITGYQYSSSNGSTWASTGCGTAVTCLITQNSFPTPSDLQNDIAHLFRVRAVNIHGNGPQSSNIAVTPRAAPTISSVSSSDVTTSGATVTVALSNAHSQSITVYARYQATYVGAPAATVLEAQTTTGTSLTYTLTGLDAGTEYRFQAAKDSAHTLNNRNHNFSTLTTVAISPDPSASAIERLTDREYSPSVSLGVQNVTVNVADDTGALALATSASNLDCTSSISTLEFASVQSFHLRGCAAGTATVTITDSAHTSITASYTVTITDVESDIDSVVVSAITADSATVTVNLINPDGVLETVRFRRRTPPTSGTWGAIQVLTTTGTSVAFSLDNLFVSTEYRAQASLNSSFSGAAGQTEHTDFTTHTQVAISPVPAADPPRLSNQRLHASASVGVQDVTIAVTNGTGDAVLHGQESGLTCQDYDIRELSIASVGSVWIRYCEAGTVTVTITDDGNSAVTASYDVLIGGANATVNVLTAQNITTTSFRAHATLANPDGATVDVWFRHRTVNPTGGWSTPVSVNTSTTSAHYDFGGLTDGQAYQVQASLTQDFAIHKQRDFTTPAEPQLTSRDGYVH